MRSLSEEANVGKGIGLKIALIVVSILFVISLFANLYLYTRQYGITPDSGLENQIADLQNQVTNLQNQISSLQNEIDSLKTPQLHRVEVSWTDNHPWFASPYIDYYGTIFNSGSQTAYSVVLTVRIYDASDTLLKTEEIHLGNIAGKSYQAFDVDIEYSGDADHLTSALTYD